MLSLYSCDESMRCCFDVLVVLCDEREAPSLDTKSSCLCVIGFDQLSKCTQIDSASEDGSNKYQM